MTTYFITRHAGARDWAAEEGISVDQVIDHLEPEIIKAGDTVLGTLPVSLAAEVCARGGHYLHLSMTVPPHLRGQEMSVADMRACGATLEGYWVERVERSVQPIHHQEKQQQHGESA